MSSIRQPGLLEDVLRRRDGADAHQVRLDAGVGEADEPHRRLEPELRGGVLGGEQAGRGAVGEAGGVARGDAAAGTERGTEGGKALEGGVGAEELVAGGNPPAFVPEDAHRHNGLNHDPVFVVPGAGGTALALEGVTVGRLTRQLGEGVVEVLGRLSHHGGALVDQSLADEARIEVDLGAHRVMPHVLDAADDHEVGRAHRDLAGAGRRRGEGARAHPVDGESGNGVGEAGEECHVAAEGEALVADLGRGGEDDVADALGRHVRVSAQELADGLDGHVVGARLPEETARTGLAEGGAHAVDEDDFAELAGHALEDNG